LKFAITLIENGTIVTSDSRQRVIKNGAIAIEKDRILDLGATSQLRDKYSTNSVVDAKDKIVMPGMICCHSHMYNAITVDGLAKRKGSTMIPFILGLEDYWWPYVEDQLTKDEIYTSALISSIEMVKAGATCIVDCLEAPYSLPGALDREAEAVRKIGIRGILSIETSERVSEDNAELAAKENLDFVKKWNEKDDIVKGKFCTHTTFSCSEKLFRRVRGDADRHGGGIQIHLEEGRDEGMFSLVKYRKTPVEFYEEIGYLGSDLLAAQCVHTSDKEIEILRKHCVSIAHTPTNKFGVCPVTKMLQAGLTIGLGTDGLINMFEAMRLVSAIHKAHLGDPTVLPPEEIFAMATRNGAKAAGYGKMLGSLEPGKKADIVILEPKEAVPLTAENAIEQLVMFGGRLKVQTVIVDGKPVIKDGKMTTVDQQAIYERSREVTASFWEKLRRERKDLPHPKPYRS
jgi:5-methylthioadenosine/S-adenosylhomocysteine deaminase